MHTIQEDPMDPMDPINSINSINSVDSVNSMNPISPITTIYPTDSDKHQPIPTTPSSEGSSREDLSEDEIPWDRSMFLGGSDMGAILGLSPYRSAVDVWLEKTQRMTSQADNLVLRFGKFAEDFVAQEYERATGCRTHIDPTPLVHEQHEYLMGHVDRWVIDTRSTQSALRILECKTTHPQQAHLWGEPGSDQIPMAYFVQCAWYMMLANSKSCDVAVLIGNNDFRIYTLHQDPELEALLLETAIDFWQEHVLLNIPPLPRSEEDCRQLYRQSDVAQSIEAPDLVMSDLRRYHDLQAIIKEKEAMSSDIKQRVMQTLGEADTLTYQGRTVATWKAPKPSIKTNYKQLELDHPDWLAPYQITQENSRRLLIKELP